MGRRLARELAAQGAKLLLHGRDQACGETTLAEIREATGNDRLTYYRADFSSLDDVRALSRRIIAGQSRLDVLVNNAGIGAGPSGEHTRSLSRDGHELRFAINYLAPFLLTRSLLQLLKASAPARIVNVASAGQAPIDFQDVMLERGYDGARAYSQSKLALISFTFDLAEELEGTAVTANALHPATYMNTKMVFEHVGYHLSRVEDGVAATMRLVVNPDLQGVSGRYFDRTHKAQAARQAYDRDARARLRLLSERLTGIRSSVVRQKFVEQIVAGTRRVPVRRPRPRRGWH